jgi:hypothetical protein
MNITFLLNYLDEGKAYNFRFIEKNPIKYNPNADKSKNLMILNIMNHKKTDK